MTEREVVLQGLTGRKNLLKDTGWGLDESAEFVMSRT